MPSLSAMLPGRVRAAEVKFADDGSTRTSTGPSAKPSQLPGSISSNCHTRKMRRGSLPSRTIPARLPSMSIIRRCSASRDSRVVLKRPSGVRLSSRAGARCIVGANRAGIRRCCPRRSPASSATSESRIRPRTRSASNPPTGSRATWTNSSFPDRQLAPRVTVKNARSCRKERTKLPRRSGPTNVRLPEITAPKRPFRLPSE